MKKLYAAITVCALALSVGVTALAQGKAAAKSSKKSCCCATREDVTPEQLKKFKADTIDLRQEMTNKQFDLQRENLKESPDSARVEALKADIAAVKAKIDAIRVSSKLPESVCHKVCRMMDEDGGKCGKCDKTAGCGCKDCQKGKSCSDCSKCKECKNCSSCKDCKSCAKSKKQETGKTGCKHCNNKK